MREAILREVSGGAEQRWFRRQHSWVRTSAGGFDPSRYTVEPITLPQAREYVCAHHYSGTYVADRYRFGLFHHAGGTVALVGVAVFGVPTSARVLTNVLPELVPYQESIELSRLVLEGRRGQRDGRAPANSESWFVARCFAALAVDGVRGVVAFSDPVPRRVGGRTVLAGHVGTVYQSLGARYLGRATARTLTLLPDGTVLSARALQKVRAQERGHEYVEKRLMAFGARAPRAGEANMAAWLAEALTAAGTVRLRHRGNLRYVFTLGVTRRQRDAVRVVGQPLAYPKQPDVTVGAR